MRTVVLLVALLLPFLLGAQFEAKEDVTVSKEQKDDIYLAGETVNINTTVNGDVVASGGKITVRDSIHQDLLVAGGDIIVKGYVADDIRAAGGSLTIDTEVGDDVIVFGGEVLITEDAVIYGNLITFSGTIKVNGEVKGLVKAYGGNLTINGKIAKEAMLYGAEVKVDGEIGGNSKIVAEKIKIGDNAKFYGDVEYWSEDGEVDFKDSLINTKATFNEELQGDREGFSWKRFGMAAAGFWLFYIFSAFLVILVLNTAFKDLFSKAVAYVDNNILKSLGYGLLYLFGLPLLIVLTFVIIIGIPIGLFLLFFYLFSLLFGHLVAALLLTHYLNKRNESTWNFWTIVFLALGIAAVLRLLTLIPFIGIIISIVTIAVGYGVLALTLLQNKLSLKIN